MFLNPNDKLESCENGKSLNEATEFDDSIAIIFIGSAAGKDKFTIVDKSELTYAVEFYYEAQTMVDMNGTGSVIFAFAYHQNSHRDSAVCLHELIWLRNNGAIPSGHRVCHRNRIAMDNRTANLTLIPIHEHMEHYTQITEEEFRASEYYNLILEIPSEIKFTTRAFILKEDLNYWNEVIVEHSHTNFAIFKDLIKECHFTPCLKIEKCPFQFDVCGRCRDIRYCGEKCQGMDWVLHKNFCIQNFQISNL